MMSDGGGETAWRTVGDGAVELEELVRLQERVVATHLRGARNATASITMSDSTDAILRTMLFREKRGLRRRGNYKRRRL